MSELSPDDYHPALFRYRDLYRAARLLIGIGNIVKVAGILLGVAVFLVCVYSGAIGSTQPNVFGPRGSAQSAGFAFGTWIVGGIFGVITGGILFLFGILISAQGQILLAQADAAIHTSPFLTDEQKAKAMAVPFQAPPNNSLDRSGG